MKIEVLGMEEISTNGHEAWSVRGDPGGEHVRSKAHSQHPGALQVRGLLLPPRESRTREVILGGQMYHIHTFWDLCIFRPGGASASCVGGSTWQLLSDTAEVGDLSYEHL